MQDPSQTETIAVHLHSRNGQTFDTLKGKSECVFQLDSAIRADFQNFSGSVRIEASLLSTTIPHSWYCIKEGSNSLEVAIYDETNQVYIGNFTYYFPPGNYDGSTVATVLQNGVSLTAYPGGWDSFWAQAQSAFPSLTSGTFKVSYYPELNKFGFVYLPATGDSYTIAILPDSPTSEDFYGQDLSLLTSTQAYNFGLEEDELFLIVTGGSSDVTVLPRCCTGNPIKTIYLKADFARTSISPWDFNRGSVLASIPVPNDVGYGEEIIYTPPNASEVTVVSGAELNLIKIELVDHNNDHIDFNGRDWTCTIQFRVIKNKFKRSHIEAFDDRNHGHEKHQRTGSLFK